MLADYDTEGVSEVLGLEIDTMPSHGRGLAEPARAILGMPAGARSLSTVAHPGMSGPLFIEQAVDRGLPRQVLRHLAERIAGGDKAKVAALEWSVVPKTTLERRETRLSPQESERTERVARLFVQARRALGSEDEARAFMLAAHPELDDRTPIEAARTDLATRRVERILGALEYGLVL